MDAAPIQQPNSASILPPKDWARKYRIRMKWASLGVGAFSALEFALTYDPAAAACIGQNVNRFAYMHIIDLEKRIQEQGGPKSRFQKFIFKICKEHITHPKVANGLAPDQNLKLFAFKGERLSQYFGIAFAGFMFLTASPYIAGGILALALLRLGQIQNLIHYTQNIQHNIDAEQHGGATIRSSKKSTTVANLSGTMELA